MEGEKDLSSLKYSTKRSSSAKAFVCGFDGAKIESRLRLLTWGRNRSCAVRPAGIEPGFICGLRQGPDLRRDVSRNLLAFAQRRQSARREYFQISVFTSSGLALEEGDRFVMHPGLIAHELAVELRPGESSEPLIHFAVFALELRPIRRPLWEGNTFARGQSHQFLIGFRVVVNHAPGEPLHVIARGELKREPRVRDFGHPGFGRLANEAPVIATYIGCGLTALPKLSAARVRRRIFLLASPQSRV
jgi:hypothetical protein